MGLHIAKLKSLSDLKIVCNTGDDGARALGPCIAQLTGLLSLDVINSGSLRRVPEARGRTLRTSQPLCTSDSRPEFGRR